MLLMIDLCNLKTQGRISGSVRKAMRVAVERAANYSGFSKIEVVVDSHEVKNVAEREVIDGNIEYIFPERTADDYILGVVLGNIKNGKYRGITIVTGDKELRIDILFRIGPQPRFELDFLEVNEFLNHNS